MLWYALTSDAKSDWLPKDLDIFCCHSAVPRIRSFLAENKFSLMEIYFKDYGVKENSKRIVETWYIYKEEYPLKGSLASNEKKRNYLRHIEEKHSFPRFNINMKHVNFLSSFIDPTVIKEIKTIQLIYRDNKEKDLALMGSAKNLIENNFDFSALENWFDGKHITVTHPDHVKTRDSEINTQNSESFYIFVRKERMEKYKNRGMTFSKWNA